MVATVVESPMLTANSTEQQGGENGSNSDRISDVDCKLNRARRGENVKNSDRVGSAEFRGSALYQASARMPSISDFGGGAEPAASLLPSLIVSRLATPK
uniref:Uncharacterized protein n=1 Tax=Fagus sylvatica TaxID=28930 RepID=A0A2N9FBP5_FAGSY